MREIDDETRARLESQYPGILDSIRAFDQANLPSCDRCQSANTASVQIGIIGRTINIAYATSKFKLIPNGPKPGTYFCNDCSEYFG